MPVAKWTEQAESDLEEIAFYIAFKDGRPVTADLIIDEFRAKAELYARQPLMGSSAEELGENLFTFTHKRWVVIYQAIHDGIRVRAIVDGARDFPAWSSKLNPPPDDTHSDS